MERTRNWLDVGVRVVWASLLLLTSVYGLLASLPYTYYALIKAPAYAWVPWVVGHDVLLFWVGFLGVALANRRLRGSSGFWICWGLIGVGALAQQLAYPLSSLEPNAVAYWIGVGALWPIILVGGLSVWQLMADARENGKIENLPYATALALAAGIALVYACATRLQGYVATRTLKFTVSDAYLTGWSIFSHCVALILIISLVNLVRLAAGRTARPRVWRTVLTAVLVFAFLWVILARFLENAFSYEGWQVHLYAVSLAGALTLLVWSAIAQLSGNGRSATDKMRKGRMLLPVGVAGGVVLGAVVLEGFIGGADWNNFLQGTFAIGLWIVLAVCLYGMVQRRERYTWWWAIVVMVVTLIAYKGLQATEIFWGKPLGKTDDEIRRQFEKYAGQDVSFNLAHHLLGNGRAETCGEACRIMRAYTNIPNAQAKFDLKLVDSLAPSNGAHPNIYFIVVDSMRPDYLGAYNAKVDFTPNLDAFAKENIVMHNVYSSYAGTSLSEPAIWAGALLLHAHFLQPFSRLNSLEKLARVDGYQMVVSKDEILSAILPASEGLVMLDKDLPLWNQLEIGATLEQLKGVLSKRPAGAGPVFFYSQPKNVHQFAKNNLPTPGAAHWQARPGFSYRISYEVHQVDEALGGFFAWLKERGQYESSIIIITADHGDATGEFGRSSHSVVLYPEIMRVPLLIHLPSEMRKRLVYDDSQVSDLVDITPTLYYLLGHQPLLRNRLFGQPLFGESLEEVHSYGRKELFLASDERAAYGILGDNGRYFYATYDNPPQRYLFDLLEDPNAEHSIVSESLKRSYDERVIGYLNDIGDFYGYKPGVLALTSKTRPE